MRKKRKRDVLRGEIRSEEKEIHSEEKEIRSEEKSVRRGKAKGKRKTQRAREATKKWVSDQRRRDNSPFRVLRQASVWYACGCEQCRQQVRHGSITNNTRV